jgi:dTDP-L-rhamnose 4-epimerase
VREYAELIGRLVGWEVAPETPGKYRFGDTRHILSDISRLRTLGWEPQVSLPDIAAGYMEWARAQPGLRDYSREADRTMAEKGTVRVAGS